MTAKVLLVILLVCGAGLAGIMWLSNWREAEFSPAKSGDIPTALDRPQPPTWFTGWRGASPSAANAEAYANGDDESESGSNAMRELVTRLEAAGYCIDMSAYEDLPAPTGVADVKYLLTAAEAVAPVVDQGQMATYTEYELINREDFLREAVAREVRRVPVCIKLVPSPVRLKSLLDQIAVENGEAPRSELEIADLAHRGIHYGHGIYFTAGPRSSNPTLPCTAMPAFTRNRGPQFQGEPTYFSSKELGKAIVQQDGLVHAINALKIGDPDGATLLGLTSTVEVATGIYMVEYTYPNGRRERTFAVPVADGNGAAREDRPWIDKQHGGRLENQVSSPLHDDYFGRHSLLKVPLPRPPGKDDRTVGNKWYPQERIVVDHHFAIHDPPIAVVRRAATWRPFMEDYVIDNRLSFSGDDAGNAELVVVFTSIEARGLLQVLGALHDTDVSELLQSEALIERLDALRPRR